MKTISIIFSIVFSLLLFGNAKAQKVEITSEKLPSNATTFLKGSFGGETINLIYQETDDRQLKYEVQLVNGLEIEFDKEGNWKEIDGNKKIALNKNLLEAPIASYVSKNYPNASIIKIEKEATKYEIELSNGVDLDFDRKGNFLKVDN